MAYSATPMDQTSTGGPSYCGCEREVGGVQWERGGRDARDERRGGKGRVIGIAAGKHKSSHHVQLPSIA